MSSHRLPTLLQKAQLLQNKICHLKLLLTCHVNFPRFPEQGITLSCLKQQILTLVVSKAWNSEILVVALRVCCYFFFLHLFSFFSSSFQTQLLTYARQALFHSGDIPSPCFKGPQRSLCLAPSYRLVLQHNFRSLPLSWGVFLRLQITSPYKYASH